MDKYTYATDAKPTGHWYRLGEGERKKSRGRGSRSQRMGERGLMYRWCKHC